MRSYRLEIECYPSKGYRVGNNNEIDVLIIHELKDTFIMSRATVSPEFYVENKDVIDFIMNSLTPLETE